MKVAIDATNLKAGGGLTHLKRLLEFYDPRAYELRVIGGPWLQNIPDAKWIEKKVYTKEFSSIWRQEIFKATKLKNLLSADIAFIPGGAFSSKKINYVSMSQNMLVFEEKERNRFPISFNWFRYKLLERLQLRSFRNANGIIYISHYAKNYIEKKYPALKTKPSTVIYHGISDDFRQAPKKQIDIKTYTPEKPFKLLYVSIINYYKHQWNVVEAVKIMKEKGYHIELELVGPMYHSLQSKMEKTLKGTEQFITYKSKVPYDQIALSYKNADMFIFASTCENMPNILVEAMSAGLPILCSNYGPMPEVLGDAGIYMDPTDVNSISTQLEMLLLDRSKRQEIAQKAYKYSQEFSWEKTANETFNFIKEVAQENKVK